MDEHRMVVEQCFHSGKHPIPPFFKTFFETKYETKYGRFSRNDSLVAISGSANLLRKT
jgi:hypothetical protein